MIIRCILLRFGFTWVAIFHFCCNQNKEVNPEFYVKLDSLVTDSIPFVPEINFIKFSDSTVNSSFFKNAIFGRIKLQVNNNSPYASNYDSIEHINFLVTSTGTKKTVIIDRNSNNEFEIAEQVELGNQTGFAEIPNIDFKLGDTIVKTSILVQPVLDFLFKSPNNEGNVAVRVIPIFRQGNLVTPLGDSFKLALFNHFFDTYTTKNSYFIVVPYENDFPSGTSYPVQYRIGDTVYLNGFMYLLKSVSERGNRVMVQLLGSHSENIGIDSGKVAIKIVANDIVTGHRFESTKSTKMTLLDFWGTWCVPCIELSGELKSIQSQYKDKLDLVGIAYDKSESKVREYLKKNGMDWINLYDQQDNSFIVSKYKINEFPTFILINEENQIVLRAVGKEGLHKVRSYLQNRDH